MHTGACRKDFHKGNRRFLVFFQAVSIFFLLFIWTRGSSRVSSSWTTLLYSFPPIWFPVSKRKILKIISVNPQNSSGQSRTDITLIIRHTSLILSNSLLDGSREALGKQHGARRDLIFYTIWISSVLFYYHNLLFLSSLPFNRFLWISSQ